MKISRRLALAGLVLSLFVAMCGCQRGSGLTEAGIKEEEKKKAIKDELLVKAEEYANLSYPLKAEPAPTIKGKVVIVSNIHGRVGRYEWRPYEIQGYKEWSGAEDERETELYGFYQADLATSPEEVTTLIQIKCDKGKEVGRLEEIQISFTYPYYASVCNVSVIDMDTQKVIAQKTFVNDRPVKTTSDVAKPKEPNTKYILKPAGEITDYLRKMRKGP